MGLLIWLLWKISFHFSDPKAFLSAQFSEGPWPHQEKVLAVTWLFEGCFSKTPARGGPLLREAASDSRETRHQPRSAPSPTTPNRGLSLQGSGKGPPNQQLSLPTLSFTLFLFYKSEDQSAILKVAVSQDLVTSSKILSVTKTRSAEDKN